MNTIKYIITEGYQVNLDIITDRQPLSELSSKKQIKILKLLEKTCRKIKSIREKQSAP